MTRPNLAGTLVRLRWALLLMLVGCGGPSVLDLSYQRGSYNKKVRPVRAGVYYFEDNRPGWPSNAAMRMFDGARGHGAGMKHTSGDNDVHAFVAQSLRAELSAMGMKIPSGADFNRDFDPDTKLPTTVDRIVVGRINYFGAVGPVPSSNAAPIAKGAVLGGLAGAVIAGAIVGSDDGTSGVTQGDEHPTQAYIDIDLWVIEPRTDQIVWARSIHKKSSMGVLSGAVANRVAEYLAETLQEALKTATWRSDFLTAMGTTPLPTEAQAKAATEHEAKAKALFDAEKFAEAAKEFRQAYAAGNDPNLLYNIGLCYRRVNDAEPALAAYQEYLRRVPGSPHRSNVEARIDELKRELRSNGKT
jgi:hypothetical protein